MNMFCFKVNKEQVYPFSYNEFVGMFADEKKGKERWEGIKEKLKKSPKTYKEAKYICESDGISLYLFGFGLSQELIKEMIEEEKEEKKRENKEIEYYLLHKDLPLLEFKVFKNSVVIGECKVLDFDKLPLYLQVKNGIVIDEYVNEWLNNRSMRLNRLHYDRLVNILKLEDDNGVKKKINEKSLVIRSNALSLNDCYWIRPKNVNIKWKEINYFDNDFDVAINRLYCNTLEIHQPKKFKGTPNNTTAGQLRKVWEINKENERILIKKTDGVKTDVINEKIVSDYLDICGVEHIKYDLVEKYNGLCCSCKNACSEKKEYISFEDLLANKYNDFLDDRENVVEVVKQINKKINYIEQFENMILIDILFGNNDRHWGNFGVLRDSNTFEIINYMPIFDNGFSMCGSEFDEYVEEYSKDQLSRFSKIDGYKSLFDTFAYIEDKKFNKKIIENIDKVIPIMEKEYKKYNINEKRIKVIKEFLQENINKIKEWYNIKAE